MSEGLNEISLDSLKKDVFQSENLVLLYFCANWWKACRQMDKILEELLVENSQNLKVYKVDFDKHRGLSKEFEVLSLPTLIFFKNGDEKLRLTGSQSKKQLEIEIVSLT